MTSAKYFEDPELAERFREAWSAIQRDHQLAMERIVGAFRPELGKADEPYDYDRMTDKAKAYVDALDDALEKGEPWT